MTDQSTETPTPSPDTAETVTTPVEPSPPETPTETPVESAPAPTKPIPSAADYVLPKGIPDSVRQYAHESQFTQEQLDSTLQYFGNTLKASRDADKANLQRQGEEHVKSWGENAEYNMSLAKRALKQTDTEGKLSEFLKTTGMQHHPIVLEYLLSLGQSLKEGGFLKSAVHRPPGQKTAAQAMYGESHPSKE